MADPIGHQRANFARERTSCRLLLRAAAGYHISVVGFDEASARSALAAMQDRLARDPAFALGVASNATVEEVRAAFLRLTKQYHPVRFGRMALDIQRLSNEVFLALRAAHDTLAKAARRQSGPIMIARTPTPSASQLQSQLPVPSPPPLPHSPTGVPPQNARASQPTPPKPVRSLSLNDSGERPAMQPRTRTPAMGVKALPLRPPGQPAAARPPSPVRQTGGLQIVSHDEATVVDLLQRQQWNQARSMLHQLLAREPSSKRIRALMSYARGREAQLDGRVDDARVELQDALDLDPDLQLAKTALTELFTRRK